MKNRYFGTFIAVLCLVGLSGSAMAELLTNQDFETWTAGANGPPDNWALSDTALLVAAQESGTIHGGSYSVAFTCSTTETSWLYQTVTIPEAESCYTFSCWAYDNDFYGRARVGIRWFAADDSTIVDSYFPNTYTDDLASWQQITTGSVKAPSGAVYAHCELRMYDANADTDWTHTTIYFDDASFILTTCPPPSDSLGIAEIQYNVTNQGTGDDCYPSPYTGETKRTSGIVTQRGVYSGYPDFWIQDADTAWSGLFIFQPTYEPNPGDLVIVEGDLSEYFGTTEMSNLTYYEVVSTGNPVPDPIDIVPGDLADSYLAGCDVNAEPYEGLLCKLTNVICAVERDSSHEYALFYVTDFSYTDTCQIEEYIFDWPYPNAPAEGDTFLSITGIVNYGRDEYELCPRTTADIVFKNPPVPPGPAITGISWTPTLPQANSVKVMASIFDTAATVVNDSILYQLNDTTGTWTGVASDSSSDNYHYFTIPGQATENVVYFYAYAENDTGGVSSSPIKKYTTTEDDQNVRINEILYNPTGADVHCFIELYGPPELPLTGYSVVMVNGFDGTDKKTIDLTGYSIPTEDGFFVIAQDDGVSNYDIIDANADFENGPDNVHLRRNGYVVDAMGYGTFDQSEYFMGETWPAYNPGFPYGFSLCRYPDGADADYNRKDFGIYGSAYNTPGTANAAPTEYSIYDIQNESKGDSPHKNERVIVGGIVTADPVECTYNPGYYIEMSSGGQWSGILVYDLFYEPTRGDSVQVKGTVTEEYNRTQISYVTDYTNYGAGTLPDPYPTTTGNVYSDESLEGVLVQVMEVTVVDTLGGGEFWITDGAAADTCVVDDVCGYSTTVAPGDEFAVIRGVVDYYLGRFLIEPRDDDDLMEFAPADLMAVKSSGDINLEWTGQAGAQYYVIYRSTDPTATPGSLDVATPPTTDYLDVGAAGSTGTNYYYLVQARYTTGKSDSRPVGEFDKSIANVK
jgi:hypothetical protein